MKMIQVTAPCNQPWHEVFYDGEVLVVNNIVDVKYEHWRDTLLMRGFVEYKEPQAEAPTSSEAPPPKLAAQSDASASASSGSAKRTRSRKKVSNGDSEE